MSLPDVPRPLGDPRSLSVPSPLGSNQLSTEVRRDLVSATVKELAETGLIDPAQQKVLTIAAQNLGAMTSSSGHSSKRHFGRIDTEMSIRQASPVSEARICLESMQQAWDGVNTSFMVYRERFLEIKLLRARLSKRAKEADLLPDGDDRTIAMAECELEQARVDRMQKEFMEGAASVKAQVERATSYSQKYQLICTQAGKGEVGFTEADFRTDEIMYYLTSALWHTAQTFNTDDQRDTYDRQDQDEKVRPDARGGERRRVDWNNLMRARKAMQIIIPHDAKLALGVMGITEAEVKADLKLLEEQRFNFNLVHSRVPQSFEGHFDGWLSRTAQKYKDRVSATLVGSLDKFLRVQQLLKADAPDDGAAKGDVAKIGRRSVIQ